jgi:hypothetical protein
MQTLLSLHLTLPCINFVLLCYTHVQKHYSTAAVPVRATLVPQQLQQRAKGSGFTAFKVPPQAKQRLASRDPVP